MIRQSDLDSHLRRLPYLSAILEGEAVRVDEQERILAQQIEARFARNALAELYFRVLTRDDFRVCEEQLKSIAPSRLSPAVQYVLVGYELGSDALVIPARTRLVGKLKEGPDLNTGQTGRLVNAMIKTGVALTRSSRLGFIPVNLVKPLF